MSFRAPLLVSWVALVGAGACRSGTRAQAGDGSPASLPAGPDAATAALPAGPDAATAADRAPQDTPTGSEDAGVPDAAAPVCLPATGPNPPACEAPCPSPCLERLEEGCRPEGPVTSMSTSANAMVTRYDSGVSVSLGGPFAVGDGGVGTGVNVFGRAGRCYTVSMLPTGLERWVYRDRNDVEVAEAVRTDGRILVTCTGDTAAKRVDGTRCVHPTTGPVACPACR